MLYAYSGQQGSLFSEMDGLNVRHKHAIFSQFAKLEGLTLSQARGQSKWFVGPLRETGNLLYELKVHSLQRQQFRLPCAPFRGSYVFLDIESRSKLSYSAFRELTARALERYHEINNDSSDTTYEPFSAVAVGSVVPYR